MTDVIDLTIDPIEAAHAPSIGVACNVTSDNKSSKANLTVLTWSIDGLDDTHTVERLQYIIDIIYEHTPDIIYLQEVLNLHQNLLFDQLQVLYEMIPAADPPHIYYNVILYKKDVLCLANNPSTVKFMESAMGRHYIHCELKLHSTPLTINVINTHLESTKETIASAMRIKQLVAINNVISNFNGPCVLGGDLNIRDHEVIKANLAPTLVDVWNVCGKPENHRYTWDTGENNNLGADFTARLRFDRLYLYTPITEAGTELEACNFQLIGKERLPHGRFASDHWGVLAEFRLISH